MNVSESFALEGNKQILRTLSPFRPRLRDVFYLEYKSSPPNGLYVHLSGGRVFPLVEKNMAKRPK